MEILLIVAISLGIFIGIAQIILFCIEITIYKKEKKIIKDLGRIQTFIKSIIGVKDGRESR